MGFKVVLLSIFLAGAIVTLAFFSGFVVFINQFPSTSVLLNHVWSILGTSVVFFFLDLCLYFYSLGQIRKSLDKKDAENSSYWYRMNDLSINIFLGIGVIYTAIGMQSGLNASLGNLTQETAKDIGAWGILNRMVRGGIIMALTTTIVGGVGGYIMRLLRHLTLGRLIEKARKWNRETRDREILSVLHEIRDGINNLNGK
ncbi:MAG TPA: hypothetical protein DDZ83_02575 [Nitrospinae bacterium]|nr:hypothetical protein [Nitrospinota bacterium]